MRKTSEGQKDTKKILDEIVANIDNPEKRRKKLRDMHDVSDMDKGSLM
ncbi:hypothetical protein AAA799B03_01286 [Marine Group I thaumarchaeote SCGC AAA799-B03]|uniref:Uncharacterized protein n=3 Tax=Marine Group I TaxID=905826 RepID=A0A087S636_9ARCH|nr:hypothetical protein AAA799N04_01498 [Marine Group I thaumarchaeote SCGC AAA799-N04]KFM17916.1 hypothetical protein SCCGRSA3_01455 [Marine Group I thaumarchaeote SCGC RSA3]KFM21190.1 hypothetical protein AAA799B03_01286 [Marine Group I thaumarchaeote SCGC AAA799-B03]